jgi:hypothetical protein
MNLEVVKRMRFVDDESHSNAYEKLEKELFMLINEADEIKKSLVEISTLQDSIIKLRTGEPEDESQPQITHVESVLSSTYQEKSSEPSLQEKENISESKESSSQEIAEGSIEELPS